MEAAIKELKNEVSQLKETLHNKNLEVDLLQKKVQFLLQQKYAMGVMMIAME